MSNYPEGALESRDAPFNEKSYDFSYVVTCKGTFYNDKYFNSELRFLKETIKDIIKDSLEDLSSIEIKEL